MAVTAGSISGAGVPATQVLGTNPQNFGGGGSWATYCLAAVQKILALPMQYGTAAEAFFGYRNQGAQTSAPLPGDMVFYGGDGTAGHVGIVDPGGTTYSSVPNSGNLVSLPLSTVSSLGHPFLGFISSAKAGAPDPLGAVGNLFNKIQNLFGQSSVAPQPTAQTTVTGQAQQTQGPLDVTVGSAPSTVPGSQSVDATHSTPSSSSSGCPPTAPNKDDSRYQAPVVGGTLFLADTIGYGISYMGCIVQAITRFITTPGYWWRALFAGAGIGLVVLGAKIYIEGDLPQALKGAS